MFVGVATFELHIEHAQSLKEKRMVVRSLRERIRTRFEVSVAEVALQDLRQRARLAVALVSADASVIESTLESILAFAEQEADGRLVGWTPEVIQLDDPKQLGIPGIDWTEPE